MLGRTVDSGWVLNLLLKLLNVTIPQGKYFVSLSRFIK